MERPQPPLPFGERLAMAVRDRQSFLVVGIDPRWEWLPQPVLDASRRLYGDSWEGLANALLRFGRGVIDAVAPHAVAIKPQIAFYEQYGWWGLAAYAQTVAYAQEKGLVVIGDIKRADISTTAQAYARAHLGDVPFWGRGGGGSDGPARARLQPALLAVDAVTLNPYFGQDGVEPFVDEALAHQRGVFVLVRTSNPSARQVQDLPVMGTGIATDASTGTTPARPVWQVVAEWVRVWAESARRREGACRAASAGTGEPASGESAAPWSSVGAVVGGTYPADLAWARAHLEHSWILVPGYGAQGATAAEIGQACFAVSRSYTDPPLGVLVNASRSILYAYRQEAWQQEHKPSQWAQACAAAARQAREELWRAALLAREAGTVG